MVFTVGGGTEYPAAFDVWVSADSVATLHADLVTTS